MERYNYLEFNHEVNNVYGVYVGEDGVVSITSDDDFFTTGIYTITQNNGETWTVDNDCVRELDWA
jgi:hypothetical protein